MKHILVTGGAGYVGRKLVTKLKDNGYVVTSVDIMPSETTFARAPDFFLWGDIRDQDFMRDALEGIDAVIHLACVSNDPSFDMDREVGKSINFDCFRPIVQAAKALGVQRFIFASSSSVYGVKEEPNVTEDLPLEPMTDYALYKALAEDVLDEERAPGFETVIIRPATVCGYSPAMRLDLCVHILTMAALRTGTIKVFGGSQYRPNIHIDDICDAYIALLQAPAEKVDGEIFNAGASNMTIMHTAELIQKLLHNRDIKIMVTPSDDKRSYHVSSHKITKVLGFLPKKTVADAVFEIITAYESGKIPDPDNDKYYAIRKLKKLGLTV